MTSNHAHHLIEEYAFHNWLIHHILEGVTHEESLLQLPFGTNSLNWTLGYIVTNRSHVLEVLGVAHAWQNETREMYHTGTPDIGPDDDTIHIETLLNHLDESTGLIRQALESVSMEWLAENFSNYRGKKTREAHLSGFHWHEGFHIGQLEMLKDFVLTVRISQP
ncbi:MAG: hypothetical protein HYU84_16465 [Chloroflexi bacterium]|nr:hypothetical protein [Chloroflexota bacterium]MBI3169838.1 hypothetical protein [Chloroflexota bacterium]